MQFLSNKDFNRLVCILRVCDRPQWSVVHPESKFGFYFRSFVALAKAKLVRNHDAEMLEAFSGMMLDAVQIQPSLGGLYQTSLVTWFVETMTRNDFGMIINMALAMSSCEDEMITPMEATIAIGGGESTWRARAATGEIPGAVLKGKQWLLPKKVLELMWK